jgi:NitT/TauT family transport system permease protein
MIVIAVVALIAEWLLTMIEHRLLTWRPRTTVNE